MNLKVLLYLDYDEQSGLGHISRSRAIIEAVSNYATEIFLSSKLNPLEIESQIDFLNQTKWISHQEAELLHFNLVYVDTYSFDILNKVEHLPIERKILLIDSNYTQRLPNWADIIIDLERSTPRNCKFGGTYLFGDILVHSELESTRRSREEYGVRKSACSNLTALVNFGGSIKIEPYLRQLESTFFYNMDILYVVYCPFILLESLKTYFRYYKNVEIKPFSPNYLQDLATCDFLVTNSGTSFIEGLFVDVPMVIFNLFPNAQLNFEKLRYSKQVIYSGLATELESDWQSNVLHSLQLGGDLLKFESDDDPKIEILDEGILKVALSALCFT
ncbi:MAG: hypothetical protein Q7R42_05650 [Candidatus Planktophila sp.]|nr:hypothetical protein [Candidatus Planktophila sp.]